MSAFHIPQNERARASDLSNRKANKPSSSSSKIAKKSLTAAFMSVSEDSLLDDCKHPVDFSPISEVKLNRQVAENFMPVTDQDLSESSAESLLLSDRFLIDQDLSESSSGMLLLSDRSPSSVITIEKDQGFKAVDDHDSKLHSLEADILVRFLRKANLPNMDAGSKKLLDSLIEMALEDLHGGVPDERSRFVHLLGAKRKTRITFCCFLLCVLAISAILLFSSGNQRSFIGPLPT